jgi:hypothetical protein
MFAANAIMQDPTYDAVLRCCHSFWFCIHSFVDGNGVYIGTSSMF